MEILGKSNGNARKSSYVSVQVGSHLAQQCEQDDLLLNRQAIQNALGSAYCMALHGLVELPTDIC
jgi:hypothetical protein